MMLFNKLGREGGGEGNAKCSKNASSVVLIVAIFGRSDRLARKCLCMTANMSLRVCYSKTEYWI